MRKTIAGLLLATIAALGLGVVPAGATPNNPGYGMSCDAGTDHCTGWVLATSYANIYNYHEWTHTFDPSGAGVWDTTALQYYVCNGPSCSDTTHPIGWVLHALMYDWAVPHMSQTFGTVKSTLVLEGHYIAQTSNVLRWSPCSSPTQDPLHVSGANTASTTGYFNCYADGGWHNGGGWEWQNTTWTYFSTSATGGYWRDYFQFN